MAENHKATIDAVNEAFAKNDLEAFLAHCADDVRWTMYGDRTVNGKQAIRDWMGPMMTEAPIFTITNVIVSGDTGVATAHMTMKNKEGAPEPYASCDVYRFRGGKIAELESYVVKTNEAGGA